MTPANVILGQKHQVKFFLRIHRSGFLYWHLKYMTWDNRSYQTISNRCLYYSKNEKIYILYKIIRFKKDARVKIDLQRPYVVADRDYLL